jgi:hypothetical protein
MTSRLLLGVFTRTLPRDVGCTAEITPYATISPPSCSTKATRVPGAESYSTESCGASSDAFSKTIRVAYTSKAAYWM